MLIVGYDKLLTLREVYKLNRQEEEWELFGGLEAN